MIHITNAGNTCGASKVRSTQLFFLCHLNNFTGEPSEALREELTCLFMALQLRGGI